MAEQSLSRRQVLGTALTLGAASAVAGVAEAAERAPVAAPAVLTGTVAGRKFRALLTTTGYGPPSSGGPPPFAPPRLAEVRLLALSGRMVQLRVEASSLCYTAVTDYIPTQPLRFASDFPKAAGFGLQIPVSTRQAPQPAYYILNHTHIGVVEAIGPQVKRVQPGDRVIVGVTSQCGQCYQCLNGSAEMCQFLVAPVEEQITPIATTADGVPVIAALGIGGLSELSVVFEEYCFPVFTELSSVDLALLGDQLASGLAAGISKMQIQTGSDVVVFGAGPVGLGAVQSARLRGAAQIIVVEPIRQRREMASKLGATVVLDPNVEGDDLVPKIHMLCRARTERPFAGGHRNMSAGADYSIGTVGKELIKPRVEQGPDPTGVLPMQQTFAAGRLGGHVCWLGNVVDAITLPAADIAIGGGRTIWPGQQAGLQSFRDLPKFVRLMERGLIDARSLIGGVYPLDRTVEAATETAYRTKIATVIAPNA